MKHTFTVKGMHCNSCVMLISDALTELGVKDIKISLNEKAQIGKLACSYDGKPETIVKAIKAEGFEATQ